MHFTFLFLDWMLAEWNSHLTGEECFCKPLMRFIMSTFARPLLTAGVKTGIRCNTEEKPSPKFTFQKQRAVPAILLSAFQLWEAWKDVNAWLQMVLPQPQHNLWWTYKGQECSTMKCLGGQILFSTPQADTREPGKHQHKHKACQQITRQQCPGKTSGECPARLP